MAFNDRKSNAKFQAVNGTFGIHQDARPKVVLIPSSGSQSYGYVREKVWASTGPGVERLLMVDQDLRASSNSKAYGGGSGKRSSGQVHGNHKPSSFNPYGSVKASGATGKVFNSRIEAGTISRPSYAQGYKVRP